MSKQHDAVQAAENAFAAIDWDLLFLVARDRASDALISYRPPERLVGAMREVLKSYAPGVTSTEEEK